MHKKKDTGVSSSNNVGAKPKQNRDDKKEGKDLKGLGICAKVDAELAQEINPQKTITGTVDDVTRLCLPACLERCSSWERDTERLVGDIHRSGKFVMPW